MKNMMTILGLVLVSSSSFAAPLVCKDLSGDSVAIVFMEGAKNDIILSVKDYRGIRENYPAIETIDGKIEGKARMLKTRPVLNISAGTLKIGIKTTTVNCAVSKVSSL